MLRGFEGSSTSGSVLGGGLNAPDGATDILLIGNDSRTDAQGNPLPPEVLEKLGASDDEGGDLTDAMILVRIPNDGKSASAISFPRDTLVDLDMGMGETKLTETLNAGKAEKRAEMEESGETDDAKLEEESQDAGRQLLVQTLEKMSGVTIDHFAEVNLLGFYEVTNAVGGVEVCLNEPTQDDASGADFQAGRQTVQGTDALAFVRQRKGLVNELERGVRQQVFMTGLSQKILSSGTLANPAKLSALIDSIQKSVTLDEDLAGNILEFAEQMQGVAGGDVEFVGAPVHLVGESGEEDVTLNIPEMHQFAEDLLLPPAERQQKEQQREAAEQARAQTTVSVYNASGVSGLAANVLDELSTQGFTAGGSENAEATNSVVYYAPGQQQAGQDLATALGGLPAEESPNLTAGSAEVYLGEDYQGPGAQSFAPQQGVQLDGAQQGPGALQGPSPAPMQSTDAESERFTADGIPCVN
ncbi:LCP family protein [Saccharopolyspora sp. HNM0983]|uniref:LCP family protein n=2 Tax=Saccharopolyspora montiporae TaxID=2781240 RepID=A0A929BE41_9PSEU|nr:LCP family protein [Saccharopolyspora sp. HNM0983]MBE9376376.1 LCP family protein [Saccharopolyspora sp. HNM0983]